jgi:GNAT superfamily N-acetyltransferase
VFEKDIEPPESDSYGEFKVKVYAGSENLDTLGGPIARLGEIPQEVIASRLASGDVVAAAYAGGDLVGYAWMTMVSGLEVAFGTTWILYSGEAALYGSFTDHGWRGRGIQRYLDAALRRYASQNAIAKFLFTVSAFNAPMLGALKDMRKRKIMTLVLVRIRGLNWVFRKAIGAPLESRFASQKDRR